MLAVYKKSQRSNHETVSTLEPLHLILSKINSKINIYFFRLSLIFIYSFLFFTFYVKPFFFFFFLS